MRQQLSKAAARRMWKALQQHYGQGGFLLFDAQGNGGAWYSENSKPDMGETDIPWACPQSEYDLGTLEEFTEQTQRWLDDREKDRELDRLEQSLLESSERRAGF